MLKKLWVPTGIQVSRLPRRDHSFRGKKQLKGVSGEGGGVQEKWNTAYPWSHQYRKREDKIPAHYAVSLWKCHYARHFLKKTGNKPKAQEEMFQTMKKQPGSKRWSTSHHSSLPGHLLPQDWPPTILAQGCTPTAWRRRSAEGALSSGPQFQITRRIPGAAYCWVSAVFPLQALLPATGLFSQGPRLIMCDAEMLGS